MMAAALRILYVDDEPDLLDIGRMFLEESGELSVTTIQSASAALALLKTEQFDAIVSDYQMPGMDGIQFLEQVRANLGKIPFILFTGRGREEIVIQAINHGADFYLQKGGEPQSQFVELAHKIKTAVERRTAETAFHESENRYRSLVDTMHDCVAVYRALADGDDFVFVEFNHAAEKSENLSRDEVIGHRVTEVFPGVQEFGLLDVFRRVWHTGIPEMFPVSFYRDNRISGWRDNFVYKLPSGEIVADYRDETARKLSDEALLKSEEQYRSLVETTGTGYVILDTQGRVISANNEYLRLIGRSTVAEIVGRSVIEWTAPHDLERNTREVEQCIIKGQVRGLEIDYQKPDGTLQPVEINASVIMSDSGQIVLTLCRDITDRKRIESELERKNLELGASNQQLIASEGEIRHNLEELTQKELALRESEDRFRGIFDTISSGVAIYEVKNDGASGKDYIIKDFNNTALELEGKKKEEVIGRSLFDLRPSIDDYGLIPVFRQVWKSGVPGYFPQKVYIDDKYSRWYENRVFRLLSGEIVAIYDDVTDRKRAEEEITFKNLLLTTQQETSPDGILVVDENGKILFYNQKFCEIWGIPKDIIASRVDESLLQFVLGQLVDPEAFLSRVRYLYDHKSEKSFEEILLKDRRILERFSVPMLGEKGNYYGRVWYFRDITVRKSADEALRESEHRYREQFEGSRDGYVVVSPDGRIIDANHAFCTMLGYSLEELQQMKDFYSVTPERWRKWEQEEIWNNRLMKEGLSGIYEKEYIRKDKTIFPVELQSYTVFEENGKPQYLWGVSRDITERKRAEESLRNSERNLREAQAIAHLGRWELDLVHNILSWSEGIYQLFEINPAEFKATYEAFLDYIHPEDHDRVNAAYTESLDTKKPYEIVHRLLMKDGRVKWVNEICQTEYDGKGQPLRSVGTVQEITGIKRAEEELKASEEKYRMLFTSMIDGFALLEMIYDEQGKPLDCRYVDVNPAHEKLTGLKPGEILGRTVRESIPGLEDYWIETYARADKTGIPEYFENYVAGLKRWYGVFAYRTTPGFVAAVFEDITGRKVAEETLLAEKNFSDKLFDTPQDTVFLFEPATGKTVRWNRRFAIESGYTDAEIAGMKAPDDFYDQADLIKARDAIAKKGAENFTIELSLVTKLGARIPFEYSAAPVEAKEGTLLLLSIGRNLTERKRAEKELKKAAQRISAHIDNSPLAIIEFDSQFRVIRWSESAKKIFGWSPEEITGKSIGEMRWVYEEDTDRVLEESAGFLDGTRSRSLNVNRNYRKDGSVITCEWYNSAIYDERGSLISVFSQVADITGRNMVEETLRKTSDQLRFALRSAKAGTWDWDFSTGKLVWSPEFFDLFGLPQNAIPSFETWLACLHPDDRTPAQEILDRSVQEHRELWNEYRIILSGGDVRWIGAAGSTSYDDAGEPLRMSGVCIDITGQKQADEALRESENKFRQLFSRMQSAVAIYDAVDGGEDFIFRDFNNAAEKIEKIKKEDLIGKRVTEVFPGVKDFGIFEVFQRVWRTGEPEYLPTAVYRDERDPGSWRESWVYKLGSGEIVTIYNDITERKLVEETLRSNKTELLMQNEELRMIQQQLAVSHDRYMDLYELAPVGYLTVSQKGLILRANLTAAAMLSVERHNLIKMPFSRFIHPDDYDTYYRHWKNLTDTQQQQSFEVRVLLPGGSQYSEHLIMVPAQTDEGEESSCNLMMIDLTERKQAEDALRQTKDYLDKLIGYANAPIIVWNPAFEITRFNHAFEELTGRTEQQVLGKHLEILFPNESSQTSLELIKRAQSGERWKTVEIPILNTISHEVSIVLWNSANILAPDGTNVLATIAQGQDITERKQAEDALRQTKDYLDKLIGYANAPIIVWNPAFEITRFNHAFEELTGRTEQQVIGKHLEILFPNESSQTSLDLIKRAQSGERWKTVEIPILNTISHEVSIVLWNSANILAPDGTKVLATIAQGQDITERKLMEEAVQAAVKLNQIIDTMSVSDSMKYTLNEAERCTNSKIGFFHLVNPDQDTIQLVTWSTETKKQCTTAKEPDRNYPVSKAGVWVDCLRQRKPVIHNDYASLPHKKGMPAGHVPVIRELVVPIFDEDKIVAIIGVGNKATDYDKRDINVLTLLAKNSWILVQRKQMEESLRQTKDYLENLIAYANAPIIVWNPAFEITRFNHAFEELTDRTEQQVLGKRLEILFPPESCNASMELIQKALSGERWEIVEIPIINTVSGEARIVLWNSANIQTPDGTKVLATIAQGQDITEQKELEKETKYHEQELRRFSEALATANRKLTLLSSITRHDINNQLSVLMGYLAILEKKQKDLSFNEYFQKIYAAAQQISSMIQFTREYDSIGVKAPVWQDARTVVDAAAKSVSLGKVSIKNDIPAGTDIFADPLILKVFYNLMDNALRYGKTITSIRILVENSGNEHLIVCEDDGVGVPVDEKEKIFDRGFGKNTGLGLFLSREILAITGITLRETGEPGKGARFELHIPASGYRINPVAGQVNAGEL